MIFSDSIIFILLINPIVCTHCLRSQCHSLLYHIILYHVVSYHIVSYCIAQCHTIIFIESSTISILPPCAFDLCHNFHVPGWSDRKRLGRLGNYTASPLRAFENELGVQAPVGFWDPAGFTADGSVEDFKRRRATEIKHGRISMLATMGYITPVTWICWSWD